MSISRRVKQAIPVFMSILLCFAGCSSLNTDKDQTEKPASYRESIVEKVSETLRDTAASSGKEVVHSSVVSGKPT
ncbi:MAG: hypothetical protein RMJ66_03910, partial [Bacteroidia bacterium]|nr:hypothetical protein [Bacteroidia bacterium]MDW8134193.1 hypothetical protein [Bacteroidia bacterium]